MWGIVLAGLIVVEMACLAVSCWMWRRQLEECRQTGVKLRLAQAHIGRLLALVPPSAGDSALWEARAFLDWDYLTWLHPRRGTWYHVLFDGGVRMNFAGKVRDGDDMVLYQDVQSGHLSVRAREEFHDGRFMCLGRVCLSGVSRVDQVEAEQLQMQLQPTDRRN